MEVSIKLISSKFLRSTILIPEMWFILHDYLSFNVMARTELSSSLSSTVVVVVVVAAAAVLIF
jgi:hypothetical protein